MTSQPNQYQRPKWVLSDDGEELRLIGKDGGLLASVSRWSDKLDASMFWAGEGPSPVRKPLGIYKTFATACRSVAEAVGVDIEPPKNLLEEWGDDEPADKRHADDPKPLVTPEWAAKMVEREGDTDPTTGRPEPAGFTFEALAAEEWPALKKALWRVVVGAEINARYIGAFDFTEKLYQAALVATPPAETVVEAWPEPTIVNPDIANPTGVPYIDSLIHRLLDAQQDINLAANERMDQSLCNASALMDEVERCIRRLAALAAKEASR